MSNADHLRDANPWHPITDPVDLMHLGKLAEELCECACVATSCIIFGLGGKEPETAAPLRTCLESEVADVRANIDLAEARFGLSLRFDETADDVFAGNFFGPFTRRLNTCGCAVARCIIQGIDELHPVTGKPNREWLEETVGAVSIGIEALIDDLGLDRDFIEMRATRKAEHLQQWHALA